MKKIILSVMFILVYTLTAVAGSVPEDLLHEDGAEIFFAEVLSVGDEVVELSPVKKIKGDVKPGTKQFYKNPSAVGSFDIKPGNVYLVTYFDEHNPTEIFDVTDYDTKKLKLKNITGDMWERFEKYLNEGRYEKADMERIDRKNKSLVNGKGRISLSDYMKLDRVKTKSSISVYSGPDTAEAEREYFIKLADSIILEKINTQDLPIENWHGIYLSAAENKEFVFVSSDGKVCKSNPLLSIVPNAEYGTSGGNSTTDKVFLLSEAEVNSYFIDGEARRSNYNGELEDWWTITSGEDETSILIVMGEGTILTDGYMKQQEEGVRPAIWIYLG